MRVHSLEALVDYVRRCRIKTTLQRQAAPGKIGK